MSGKSLSTSTLSLRFMQNAHRAKQLKEVELDRAEVKDEEKWEVSQVVRDSWGITGGNQDKTSEVHETSYLPFLFSEADNSTSGSNDVPPPKKTAGRMVYNKKGEMAVAGSSAEASSATVSVPSESSPASGGRKIHPRPVSISLSGKSGHLRGFDQLTEINETKKKSSKSARDAIFESGGVGTDLRAKKTAAPPTSTSFMKPEGVDDPRQIQTAPNTAAMRNSDTVIDGARQKKKPKREREALAEEPSSTTKKAKKNRKNPE